MLQLTHQTIAYVAQVPIDFRKGIDGLIGVCKKNLSIDPFNGALFLFYNKSRTSFKILLYDGEGFILYLKRLSEGKFQYKQQVNKNSSYQQIGHRALQILINNGDLKTVKFGKDWRQIKPQT